MSWQVWSKDGFEIDAEAFHVTGRYGDPVEEDYATYDEALEDARKLLKSLDVSQPNAGGQGGIQDRVYVKHPGGRLERIFK